MNLKELALSSDKSGKELEVLSKDVKEKKQISNKQLEKGINHFKNVGKVI